MTPDRTPAAFLCYPTRADRLPGMTSPSEGPITRLCEALVEEVRIQSGDDTFDVFMDKRSILVGEAWRERVRDGLENATLLLVLVQPLLLRSAECRAELEQFREAEARAKRQDLVVPVLYVDTPGYPKGADDPLLVWLASRQYFDWRALRILPPQDPAWVRGVTHLAAVIVRALDAARNRKTLPPVATPLTTAPAGPGEGWQALERFLLAAFSVEELRRVLRWNFPAVADHVPAGPVAPSVYVSAVVEALQRQDAVGPDLWKALHAERPRRHAEIEAVRARFGG